MTIHGRECNMLLTVGAAIEIAELCPNGDINKMDEVLNGNYAAALLAIVKITAALSKGFEDAKAFENKEYSSNPLTIEELKVLQPHEIAELRAEIHEAFKAGAAQKVELEPAKKKMDEAEAAKN